MKEHTHFMSTHYVDHHHSIGSLCNPKCVRVYRDGRREGVISSNTNESFSAIELNPAFKGHCAQEVQDAWLKSARDMTCTVRLRDIHQAIERAGMTGGCYLLRLHVNGQKIVEVKVVP